MSGNPKLALLSTLPLHGEGLIPASEAMIQGTVTFSDDRTCPVSVPGDSGLTDDAQRVSCDAPPSTPGSAHNSAQDSAQNSAQNTPTSTIDAPTPEDQHAALSDQTH